MGFLRMLLQLRAQAVLMEDLSKSGHSKEIMQEALKNICAEEISAEVFNLGHKMYTQPSSGRP